MPLDYKTGMSIRFSAHDFIYGLDTGQLKLRFYFFNTYIPRKQGLTIWEQHHVDEHKIDSLTQGLGPTVPTPWATKLGLAKSFTDTGASNKKQLSLNSALPKDWTSVSDKKGLRGQDRIDYINWIKSTRYSPGLSSNPEDWNARFKRTSKGGLFWALFVKGYNIHFILDKNLDYGPVVGGSKSTRGHKLYKYEAQYPKGEDGDEVVTKEEKRITWAELRWVYRHRDYACVQENVQFWEQLSTAQDYRPMPAPWLQEGKIATIWKDYKPKRQSRETKDDDMAALLGKIDKEYRVKSPCEVVMITSSEKGMLFDATGKWQKNQSSSSIVIPSKEEIESPKNVEPIKLTTSIEKSIPVVKSKAVQSIVSQSVKKLEKDGEISEKPLSPSSSLQISKDTEKKPSISSKEDDEVMQSSSSSERFLRLGSGMDKIYFYDGVNTKGWIETRQEVVKTELTAYAKLADIGISNIPQVDPKTPPPKLYQKDGTTIVHSVSGYWVEHVPHKKTIKPAMNSTFGLIKAAKDELLPFKQDKLKEKTLLEGLASIDKNLSGICSIVGELTIAVHQDSGKPYLLDVSPTGSTTGGVDLERSARKGLQNMIAFFGSSNVSQSITKSPTVRKFEPVKSREVTTSPSPFRKFEPVDPKPPIVLKEQNLEKEPQEKTPVVVQSRPRIVIKKQESPAIEKSGSSPKPNFKIVTGSTEGNKSSAVPKDQMDTFIKGLVDLDPNLGFPLFSVCDNNSFHTTGYLWGLYAGKLAKSKLDAGPVAIVNFDSHADAGTKTSRLVASDRWGGMLVSALQAEGIPAAYISLFNHPNGKGSYLVADGGNGKMPSGPKISDAGKMDVLQKAFTAFWQELGAYFGTAIRYVFVTIDRDVLFNSMTQWGDGALNSSDICEYIRVVLAPLGILRDNKMDNVSAPPKLEKSIEESSEKSSEKKKTHACLIGFDITGMPEDVQMLGKTRMAQESDVWKAMSTELLGLRKFLSEEVEIPADRDWANVIFFSGSVSYRGAISPGIQSFTSWDYAAHLAKYLPAVVGKGKWQWLLCRQRGPLYNHGWKPFCLYRPTIPVDPGTIKEMKQRLGKAIPVGGFASTASVSHPGRVKPERVSVSDMENKRGDFAAYDIDD